MPLKYIVEYRQANINTGDCQFILLVQDEEGKDPVIIHSVLVDGGDGGPIRMRNIRRIIGRIEKKYKLDEGNFKLDAMVISHWDQDHYFGILKLLDEALNEENKKIPGTAPLQVPFLKYDAGTKDPQSILYIPYPEHRIGHYTNKIVYSTTGEFGFGDPSAPAGRRLRICKYLADIPAMDLSSLKDSPKELDVGGASELIGRNLFTSHLPILAQVVSAANPKALVDAHGSTMPGLYCVAANNRYLKGLNTSPNLKKNGSTKTNRSSIICMVIRMDGTTSHYLAGDAHQDLESKVIDWTGLAPATTTSKPTLKDRIAIVKASHHGAATSTPITFCQTYKPMYFIFSSGNKHRHPTWEVLLYVYSYYISPLGNSISPQDGGRYNIYTTSFPYWIYLKPRTTLFNAEDPLTTSTPEATAYRTTITNFFDTSTADLNLVNKFENTDNMRTKDEADRAKWIREHAKDIILTRFSLINDIKYTSLPSKSKGDESAHDSKVSSIIFMSDDDNHVVEVDWINLNVISMPPSRRRSNTPPSLGGGPPTKKLKPGSSNLVKNPVPILMALTIGAENNADKKFYLMSSIVDLPSSGRGVYVPAPWDPFVSTLSYGFITLVDELKSTTQKVDLHEGDEWQSWLASAIPPASDNSQLQMSVTGSVTDKILTIDHFGLTVSVPRLSSGDTLDLTFSPARKVGPKSDPKFEPTTDFLRFDIDVSSLGSISFTDLYKFLDVSGDSIAFASDIVLDVDKNSAVWFSPLLGNYTSAFRLQGSAAFKGGDTPSTVSFLKSLGDLGLWDEITPSTVTVAAKKTTTTVNLTSPRDNTNDLEIILSFDFPSFSTTVSCGAKAYTLAIYWKEGALDAIVKVLDKISGSSSASDGFKDVLDKISSTFDILRVLVEISRGDQDSKLSLSKIAIDAQLTFKIGKASSETKDVIVMLSFAWPDLIFSGSLYVPDTVDDSWEMLMPSYEELLKVKAKVDPSKVASNLSLLDLIPGVTISTPPQGIPVLISSAVIEVDSNSFSLEGVLNAVPPSTGGSLPSVSFDSLDISLSYQWSTKTPSLCIAAVISLHPPPAGSTDPPKNPECMDDPGFLFASVEYADKKWTLTGTLININFGDLLVFFHADEQSQVVDVLGSVTIRSLFASCEYGGKGEPTKFQFDGSIEIAALELDFAYNRDSNGWSIEGGLSAAKECTVADVIHSICGGDESTDFDIPDFIGDIKLNVQHDPESHKVPQDSPVYLNCSKPSSDDSPLVFVFRLTLGKIQLSFIQISSPPQSASATNPPVGRTTKRILMFSLGDFLPSFNIPVIGKLDNPVDGLEFLWVHDKSKTAGLTRAEVVGINSAAFAQQTGIVFKELKASGAAAKTDVVLNAGCHFILLVKDSGKITAALDLKFGGPKKMPDTKERSADQVSTTKVPNSDPSADSDGDAGGMSKAAVHKTVGPLSLSNIGLQYKDSKIIVILDATLALGPIGLSLLGFGLGLKLTSTLFSNFDPSDFSVQLGGLGAALDKPPILLAGLFENLSPELFAGGIAVGIKEYSFLALGSFGVVTAPSGKFQTFFLFAQLHGPLVELEFATINGVSLGFGYNSHVKYPTVDEILSFPLVKGISSDSADAASSSSNVLPILSDDVFTKWVTPQNGSFWFAAGLEVLAFETLDVRAVAIIEFDPYVSLGLFADAVCSLPPMSPRERCFVYVELGITCRVDIRYGTFSVEGKLSPNSFVLHPSCHLLGGFALYYWFDPSPYAGDFVYTVGGYHPAYRPPSHYPRPQRLTITWQLDSSISITGESFFAITPKVCMGGGSLSVLFQTGALRAHLDAHASFLMAWNPFHFAGDIGVSVGVGFHGKFLFWSYSIEVDISASLHLEGPPFGGNVHIDFWLFGFDIYFGSHPGPPPPLSLDDFWTLLSRSSNQPNTGYDAGITLVVESGYIQGKNTQVTPIPGQPWIVTAGQFKFNIQCRFALHTVKYNSESTWKDVYESEVLVYSKPMHATESIESILKITILDKETSQDVGGFTFLPLTKNVPSAMWGQYDPSSDDLDGSNPTIKNMLTGIHVIAPRPEYPNDHIPAFNAHDAMFVEITKDEKFPVVDPSPQAKAWLPITTDWQGAKHAWSSHAETSGKVATEWSKVFGWVDKLVGSPPVVLIDKFEEVYLSIPGITSA